MKHLPNFITAFRFLGALGLLFSDVGSVAFWVMYFVCGLSDIADGFLALPHWLWFWGAVIVVIKVINQISAIVMYKKCLFLPIRFPYIRHALNI